MRETLSDVGIHEKVKEAVRTYWMVREQQKDKQEHSSRQDAGERSAVTGGAQMQGFVSLLKDIALHAGILESEIHTKGRLELPGFFRATKAWDFLVVTKKGLVAAIEFKSQVGPSFGNNFNNRSEEAIGTAVDLWTAYREGVFPLNPKPWLGFFFLLEDCPKSKAAVGASSTHFPVRPEFVSASYLQRYDILCEKLMRENQYSACAFVTSDKTKWQLGEYTEPNPELSVRTFIRSFHAQLTSHIS